MLRDQEEEGTEECGILVADEWFPIVKMEWVEGLNLRAFVEEILVTSQNEAQRLHQLCQSWELLAFDLNKARLGHLDLHHNNVLWIPGTLEGAYELKLIDYDGMWTPTLANLRPNEFGAVDYQHPDRHPNPTNLPPYCAEADRFSHLVIYTALRSLAVLGMDLWNQYGKDKTESLLFTKEDFESCRPNRVNHIKSDLIQFLWQNSSAEVHWLVGRLILAANGSLKDVPLLEDIVRNGQVIPLGSRDIHEVHRILRLKPSNVVDTQSNGNTGGQLPAPPSPLMVEGDYADGNSGQAPDKTGVGFEFKQEEVVGALVGGGMFAGLWGLLWGVNWLLLKAVVVVNVMPGAASAEGFGQLMLALFLAWPMLGLALGVLGMALGMLVWVGNLLLIPFGLAYKRKDGDGWLGYGGSLLALPVFGMVVGMWVGWPLGVVGAALFAWPLEGVGVIVVCVVFGALKGYARSHSP